jgi:hypothetical protein
MSSPSIDPTSNRRSGVRASGQRDHLGRQVDTEGIQAQILQEYRHPAGAAADVGDRTVAGSTHPFSKCSEQSPVQRLGAQFRADPVGVVSGDGVVGLSGGA